MKQKLQSPARILLLVLLILTVGARAGQAQSENAPADLVSFSFDSESAAQYLANNLFDYVEDSVFAPNNAWFPSVRFVGAGVGSNIEVDALSYGHLADSSQFDAFFSVAVGSQGRVATDVRIEAVDERASDLYASNFSGTNQQIFDGNGSSAAILGLLEPQSTNVDAVDMRAPSSQGTIYWSVSRQSAENVAPYAAAIVSGADVFFSGAAAGYSLQDPPKLYATAGQLGLTGQDDLDALVVIEAKEDGFFDPQEDKIYYSLVSASISLTAAGIPPFANASAADVFVVGGGSASVSLAFDAAQLGLEDPDDVDALDLAVRADILAALASTAVPTGTLLAPTLALLLGASARWWFRCRA